MIQSKIKRRLQCTGGSYPRIMETDTSFFLLNYNKDLSQTQVHGQKMPTEL